MRKLSFALFLLVTFSLSAYPQAWSTFLDSSRAVDWTGVGFTIPTYTTNCVVQPTLTPSSSAVASANTTAIQNALNSCDAMHNVVNIPAGTYYVAGWTFGTQGMQVLRGAGPKSTYIILTGEVSCAGMWHGVCMLAGDWTYNGDSAVQPPNGTRQCLWTGGYARGSTTITLSSCGGTPPVNKTIILDQANDSSDTNGVYTCDSANTNCAYHDSGSHDGRLISGSYHSQQQVVYMTGVTSLGGGSYSVTISPGVAFSNIRSEKNPGAWWPGFVQNDGIENLTLDSGYQVSGSYQVADGVLAMFSCYQCWAKNIRFLTGARNDVLLFQSAQDVIRDSYFYAAQSHYSTSYTIESDASSGFLVENNIFQQVTTPLTYNQASGAVVGYNFSIRDIFSDGSWTWGAYASHDAGNNMNLFEGNNFYGIVADDAWGSTNQVTIFRNMLSGYQPGTSNATIPISLRSFNRAFNVVGNVMCQPGYHNQYQAYATSGTAGSGEASENTSIYSLGWGRTGASCGSPSCDPLTFSTMMRWGNWDVVTNGTKWDSTEASPAAVPYLNANFTSSYFGSLAHTLPASLYYNSKPSWWPSAKAWPPIGSDVSSGNLGTCTGTYAGWQGTSAGQCTGGTLASQYAGHAYSIPAQDCYLNVMHGPLDGTGGVLSFDAGLCYATTSSGAGPRSPTGLTTTVH
jgi:hypothetical protein